MQHKKQHITNKANSVKEFVKNLTNIMFLFKNFKAILLWAFAFSVGATVFGVFAPKILANAINELFYGLKDVISANGNINFFNILIYLLFAAFLFAFSSLCQVVQSILCNKVSKKVCFNLRKKLINKINKLPMSYFENNSKGNLLSRVINDVDSLAQNSSSVFINLVTSTTMLIGSMIMMFTINVFISLIVIIIIPVSLLLIVIVLRVSQRFFTKQQNTLGEVNAYVDEHLSGHSVIQIFNKQENTLKEFDHLNNTFYKTSLKAKTLSQLTGPLFLFIKNLSYIIVVIIGAYLSIIGIMTVGDIQAFIAYVNNFTDPLNQIMSIFNTVQQMSASSQRITEFLNLEEDIDYKNKQKKSITSNINSKNPIISFENVSFGYNKDKKVIHKFSLDINVGDTVAIVGHTGAGKTTLVKLLMRFYDVDSGCIKLYGEDIKHLDKKYIRNNISMVLQDIWLFSGTLSENILYGSEDKGIAKLHSISKLVCIDKLVNKLADKYDTKISEGAKNFSLGEKQLICIARALAADKNILILDEATISVDTATEQNLYKTFDKLIKEKTSIVIAHRLSTIKNANTIIVLNNGNIVETGSHDELLKNKGFYYDLYNSGHREIKE